MKWENQNISEIDYFHFLLLIFYFYMPKFTNFLFVFAQTRTQTRDCILRGFSSIRGHNLKTGAFIGEIRPFEFWSTNVNCQLLLQAKP